MRITRKVFHDLAIWMVGFGLSIGIVFPFFVILLGVPSDIALKTVFFAACLGAGALAGIINYGLARWVVGAIVDFRPREIMVFPVINKGVSLGVVVLATGLTFNSNQRARLDLFIQGLGLALNNAMDHDQLQRLAALDPLTGIYNRRFGLGRLREEFGKVMFFFVMVAKSSSLSYRRHLVRTFGSSPNDCARESRTMFCQTAPIRLYGLP